MSFIILSILSLPIITSYFFLLRKKRIVLSEKCKKYIHLIMGIILVIIQIDFIFDSVYVQHTPVVVIGGDMSGFIAWTLPIPLLFNMKKIIKSIIPLALVSGTIGAIGFFTESTESMELTHYFASQFKHTFYILIALSTVYTLPRYSKKDIKGISIFIGTFFLWVLLLVVPLGYTESSNYFKYTSILWPESYYIGGYEFLSKGWIGAYLPYPIPTIVLYLLCVILIYIYTSSTNKLKDKSK